MISRSLPRLRSMTPNLATLRLHGPDGKGIVAACSNLLDQRGFEIVGTEHWTDRTENRLFLRIAFDKEAKSTVECPPTSTSAEEALQNFCGPRNLHCDINWRNRRAKVAIMVSKYDHCLWELLLRHQAHELDCDIVAVLSNHEKLRPVAETFGIPYHYFPINPHNKAELEQLQLELLHAELDVDVVVLARYMQVLGNSFLEVFPNRVINIHHSFLPAFSGSRPYHGAHERGVKLVGATAHYTTAVLDAGPIIEQDVIGVTHRDGVSELIKKGRILERNVLVRALQAHLDDRVIVYKNKCVVIAD